MKKFNFKNGYALIFTMLIISIVTTLGLGMASNAAKNIILSATARDSQFAFYQADTAGECALYATQNPSVDLTNIPTSFLCGVDVLSLGGSPLMLNIDSSTPGFFEIDPDYSSISDRPCFNITIDQTGAGSGDVIIMARGYNICDFTNPRQVERGLEIRYDPNP